MPDQTVSAEARDVRFLRAAEDVLTKYRFARGKPGADGLVVFTVTGGTEPYAVTVHPEWRTPPACSCPDAARRAKDLNAGYCKHVIAVLLRDPELRCQLLELFLQVRGEGR